MHIAPCAVSSETLLKAEPHKYSASQKTITKVLLALGVVGVALFIISGNAYNFWGSFLTNMFFWTGIAAGSCIIPAIFSIVGAKWSPPVRRIAEANSSFLPVAFILFAISFLGKEHLYPWAIGPMPGRETWMQPLFVYARFAVMLGLLFFMMRRYVRFSLRQDIGLLREKSGSNGYWNKPEHDALVKDWKGSQVELQATKDRLSWNGPLLILVYAVVYSLFAFEMLKSMDTVFSSNMMGAFIFVGNIFMGWAMLCLNTTRITFTNPLFKKVVGIQQLWDMGKLNFGFTMLWGYMFFSQFLPYWYANIPETSQWMIIRTREFPWMGLSYVVFACCFIFPFILLLSDDIKKNPHTYRIVASIILIGMWLHYYVLIMPQLFPAHIPLGIADLLMALGCFGLYRWKVHGFLEKYPYVAVANMKYEEDHAEEH